MKNTKKPTTWQEVREAERQLDEEYMRRREELRDIEDEIRGVAQQKRVAEFKARAAPITHAWRLRLKNYKSWEGSSRYIVTLKFADGTGNSYHYVDEDEETGEPADLLKSPMKPFFVEGLPFEHEPSNWLNDDHLYDIVPIDPADVPPIV